MKTKVTWKGLSLMSLGLKKIPKVMKREVNEYTKALLETVLFVYIENLSGGGPKTAWSGLPVGVRTGMLLAGAQMRQINQYAGEVFNLVEYSGWIESGTRRTPPRRPLGEAVALVELEVPGRLNKVLTLVMAG